MNELTTYFMKILQIAPGGEEILLPPGEYLLPNPLVIRKQIYINGDSSGCVTLMGTKKDAVLFQFEGTSCSLRNVVFRQLSHRSNLVVATNTNVIIEKCSFLGGWNSRDMVIGDGCGLVLRGESKGTVSECRFANNELYGIAVLERSKPELINNLCEDNGDSGIGYSGDSSGSAVDNKCLKNGDGITLSGRAKPFLRSNSCSHNISSGICCRVNSSGVSRQNDCLNNGLNGIALHDNSTVELSSNRCEANDQCGIAFYDFSGGEAINNRLIGNKCYGFGLYHSCQPNVHDNYMQGNHKGETIDRRSVASRVKGLFRR